jgi:hypothetical protein
LTCKVSEPISSFAASSNAQLLALRSLIFLMIRVNHRSNYHLVVPYDGLARSLIQWSMVACLLLTTSNHVGVSLESKLSKRSVDFLSISKFVRFFKVHRVLM